MKLYLESLYCEHTQFTGNLYRDTNGHEIFSPNLVQLFVNKFF